MTESISPNHHAAFERYGQVILPNDPRCGEFEVDIQWRCTRIREHINERGEFGVPGTLAIPCAECYSIAVSSVRIPYQPPTKRVTVTPEPRGK